MIDLYPTVCNLCGGKVEYINNAKIYGRPYGSGYCYRCTECGAYVGTHYPWPRQALGILANAQMREWKMKCHNLFDPFWKGAGKRKRERRKNLYIRLAGEMRIDVADCHFGYFNLDELKRAYQILEKWQENPPEDLEYEAASEPCKDCYMAGWTDMYGVMVYACDMSHCIKAELEERSW